MPIEIKELHIRVSVNTPPGIAAAGGRTGASSADGDAEVKDAIVGECVDQVLQILRDRTER